jgi:hypothetical protein
MKKDLEKTKVVFRVWKGTSGKGFAGGVIALFPELDEGNGFCSSYEHIGQHGGADYAGVIRATRPAAPFEIEPLKQELELIGYNLSIKSRRFYGRNYIW